MATDRLINSTQGDSIITKLDDIKTAINNQSTAATATPLMDGTATVGTSTKYARENHVHPTDTSRAANVMSDYAVDTARENITTSSTVQGAIEQLEYREELNKTNILYSDRNKMPYTLSLLKTYNTSGTWNGNAYTVNNLTFTINNDMSITVTASGAITLTDFKLGVAADIPLETGVEYWGYGGLPTSDYNYWGFKGATGISNKGLNAGSVIPDTLSNYTDVIIRISSALGAASLTFKPIIVKKIYL